MGLITRIADKAGALGSIASAMGCATCFPALASPGGGDRTQFPRPMRGTIHHDAHTAVRGAGAAGHGLGWFSHRQWHRTALGVIGPLLVLSAAILIRFYGVPTAPLLYAGLALMIGVSIWDVVAPAARRCGPDGCELPPKRG